MNLKKSLELMNKYAACQECGSELIGHGAGALVIEDGVFRRTCKCGWSVEVKDEPVQKTRKKG